MWCEQGNQFDKTLILGHRAPRNSSSVDQPGYCPAKQYYAVRYSIIINTGEAGANENVTWSTVHNNLSFVDALEYLLSAMPNRTDGMILCRDAP